MRTPKPRFSPWTLWELLWDLDVAYPGVYLLGRFRQRPRRRPAADDSAVIYVGETVNRTLHKRLREFARSAFEWKRAHSGGRTFARKFRLKRPPKWLYVSACPVQMDEPHLGAYIRYLERDLLWQFVRAHDRMPILNRK